jgi:hypothetical protein
MLAAAVAVKVAVVAPAETVTVAGTVSSALLLASVTLDPPAGAAWVNVTVHVLGALCPRLAGLHATPDTITEPSKLNEAAPDPPFAVPVMIAL